MERDSKHIGDLLGLFTGAITPAVTVDLDALGRLMARERVINERRRELTSFYGGLLNTDWGHPSLAPYRSRLEAVVSWHYQPRGLLLAGPSGCGKSRALAALAWRLAVDDGIDVALWHDQELTAEVSRRQSFGRDEARDFINALALRPVLVIEDLGQGAATRSADEFVRGWFFKLLDDRHVHGRPCLISTNHTSESLAEANRGIRAHPLIRRLLEVAAPVPFWDAK